MNSKVLRFVLQIRAHAEDAGLAPSLVAAICSQESGGNPYAQRYEPGWRYFKDPEVFAKKCGISLETERVAQASSYGLMQLMGSVAREYGLTDHLPTLYDVDLNLKYGCQHLKKFLEKHGSEEKAVASYNAGSPRIGSDGKYVNQSYVDHVLLFRQSLKGID